MTDEDKKDSGWNWVIGYFAAGPLLLLLLIIAGLVMKKIS
jgi:hypothetical protein